LSFLGLLWLGGKTARAVTSHNKSSLLQQWSLLDHEERVRAGQTAGHPCGKEGRQHLGCSRNSIASRTRDLARPRSARWLYPATTWSPAKQTPGPPARMRLHRPRFNLCSGRALTLMTSLLQDEWPTTLRLSSYVMFVTPLIDLVAFAGLAPVRQCPQRVSDGAKGQGHFPRPAGNILANTAQDAMCPVCCNDTLLSHVHTRTHLPCPCLPHSARYLLSKQWDVASATLEPLLKTGSLDRGVSPV